MKWIILLVSFLISTSLHAAIPPGQWQCLAFDMRERSYPALGTNMQEAMRLAISECRRQSHQQHCKTAQSYCEQGPLSLIADRCLVTDESGRTWNATGQNACRTALALCTEWQFLYGKTSQCMVKHR